MTILLFLPVCLTGSSAMDFPSLITADGVASQHSRVLMPQTRVVSFTIIYIWFYLRLPLYTDKALLLNFFL